jgi:hypothetical protein
MVHNLYWQDGWLISNIGQQETEALEVRLQIDADVLNVLKGLRISKNARPENISALFCKDSTFASFLTLVLFYQHTRCNVLKGLRGHKIRTCRKYINSSEHGLEEVRMIQAVRYIVKSKKDIILKNEKNFSTSNKNYTDYTLFYNLNFKEDKNF